MNEEIRAALVEAAISTANLGNTPSIRDLDEEGRKAIRKALDDMTLVIELMNKEIQQLNGITESRNTNSESVGERFKKIKPEGD